MPRVIASGGGYKGPQFPQATPPVSTEQLDPMQELNNRMEKVHNGFMDREYKLRHKNMRHDEFDTQIQELLVDYDKAMAGFKPLAQQISTMNDLVSKGQITQDAAAKASWGLMVPAGAASAMYPGAGEEYDWEAATRKTAIKEAGDPGKGLSYKTRFNDQAVEMREEALAAVPFDNPWFGAPLARKNKDIMTAYMAYRDKMNYTEASVEGRKDIDYDFDSQIAERQAKGEKWDWKPGVSPKLKAARSFRRLAAAKLSQNIKRQRELVAVMGDPSSSMQSGLGELAAKKQQAPPREAPDTYAGSNDADRQALAWAQQNPDDPRAQQILSLRGSN